MASVHRLDGSRRLGVDWPQDISAPWSWASCEGRSPNTHDVWLTVLTLREKLRGFLLVHLDDALLADGRAGGATVPDFAVDFGYVVQAAPERDAAQPACVGQQGEELHDCTFFSARRERTPTRWTCSTRPVPPHSRQMSSSGLQWGGSEDVQAAFFLADEDDGLRPVARIVDFADIQFADLHLGSP
jgi:hypothetical protein